MAELELKMNMEGVDPALIGWLQTAARLSPYRVVAYSGQRPGDPRFHGQGKAVDVNLIDPQTGKTIPNYQNAAGFQAYQAFANTVRAAQQQMNPERSKALRWGGYFSGGKGKYGAFDLMHFDVGGDTTPMGGGSWETGLTPAQASAWGLTPGGGVSPGAVTPVTSPLGDTLGAAVNEQPESQTSQMASAFAKGVSKSDKKAQSTPVEMAGDPGGGFQPVSLETPEAIPEPGSLETPGGNLERFPLTSTPLADLFQVKDIGMPVPQMGRGRPSGLRRGF